MTEPTTEQLDALIDATKDLTRAQSSNTSTSGVHIHGGGLLAVVVAMVGILGIVVAVAAVFVVAAWRSADMADLSRIRADMREQQQYRQQFSNRLNTLEAQNVKPDTEK